MGQILGNDRKKMLLEQIRRNPGAFPLNNLKKFLADYDDIDISDYRGLVPDNVITHLETEYLRVKFVSEWNKIKCVSPETFSERGDIASQKRKIQEIKNHYPEFVGEISGEINDYENRLDNRSKQIVADLEENDWRLLDKSDYNMLRGYKDTYPDSVHKDELDDFMWDCTDLGMPDNFARYLSDWPNGRHAQEARDGKSEFEDYQKLLMNPDPTNLADFVNKHSSSAFVGQAQEMLNNIKETELSKMKAAPNKYPIDKVLKLVDQGVFTVQQLINEGLTTPQCWSKMLLKGLPDISKHVKPNSTISAPENCTDIYFFGIPGSGKTCLLMSLTAVNGRNGFSIDLVQQGGDYAADLNTYYINGRTPGRTFGSFCTVINGEIRENKGNKSVKHKINLVEMSGEDFAVNIARNQEAKVKFADMGTGATNLLMNNNRKVFFIIVDASADTIEFSHLVDVKDAQGQVIDQNTETLAISQNIILTKFVNLFKANPDVMAKVDAIHFIVTKADLLGQTMEQQLDAAKNMILANYPAPINDLKNFCQDSGRINLSTKFIPHVFAFSMGKFYLGDVFVDDLDDTLDVVNTIRCITRPIKIKTWWDKFKESLG